MTEAEQAEFLAALADVDAKVYRSTKRSVKPWLLVAEGSPTRETIQQMLERSSSPEDGPAC